MFTAVIPKKMVRGLFAILLLILVKICLLTPSALAWNGNYLMVDGAGDFAEFLADGPLDVATDGSESFTVEFWVFATDYGAIVSDEAYDIGYNYDNQTLLTDVIEFRLYLDESSSVLMRRTANLLNGWHHVVCSYDNINDRAFIGIDGALSLFDPINDNVPGLYNEAFPLLIGSLTQTDGFFTGMIDEVRISDSVRYSGSTYTVPAAPFTTDGDTLALWHFNEASDEVTFADSSVNNNHLNARGDAFTTSGSTGGDETIYYLRDNDELDEKKGDPIPILISYVYPTGTVFKEWRGSLKGDITGRFGYHIDVTDAPSAAKLKIKFIVERNGEQSVVAAQYLDIPTIDETSYLPISRTLDGLDLSTQDGDILIVRVVHWSGSEKVGIRHDGQEADSDSHVKVKYLGPQACFTADPEEGELLTDFQFDAGCTTDDTYPSGQLEVRWDWENDGNWDTGYTTNKTASHQYDRSGIKTVKLMVKRPDGLTACSQKDINIPIVILDSFVAPASAPAGLAWDGSYLWLSGTEKIYRLAPDGVELDSFASPCSRAHDLAWDGEDLWVVCASGGGEQGHKLFKVNTETGAVIQGPTELPIDYSNGLAWDGFFLWVADASNERIAKVNQETGAIIQSFSSPGPDPRGLAWDGKHLWNADFSANRIFQLDTNGNLINTWEAPGTGPMGLTWDGTNIWCIDLNNYTVYKLADKIPTSITFQLSKKSLTFGELPTISGQIVPAPGEAGKGVSIELIPPSGDIVYDSALADINGEFDYQLKCGDLHRAGTWTIRTSWEGAGPYEGSVSQDLTLIVAKAESRVTLDISSRAIRLDDKEKVSISGKFTPKPDCGSGLEDIPITLEIKGPLGTDSRKVNTTDQWGHFVLKDYAGFNALGEWTVQAKFAGDAAYLASHSDPIQVRVVESAGYAIIVQGRISSEEGLASHNKSTQFVYETLKDRGLLDDDIQYFNYNTSPAGVDGIPGKTVIQNAITQWAKDKMNANAANLYIVMVDHGLEDVFYIHPEKISSSELSNWLNSLQAGLTGQAKTQEIVTILGFCRSGSFIDNLSAPYRVIIASAAENESSYKGPLDEDNIREGEYFVSEFFKAVSYGKSVKTSFEEATALTEVFTASVKTGSTNAPYFDESLQHPLLDDNADLLGSNDLESQQNSDGELSRNIFIGVSAITGNAPGDVQVTQVNEQRFLGVGETSANLLWAKVDDNARLRTIWVEVKPPGYTSVDAGGSGQAELNLPKEYYDVSNAPMRRYEWNRMDGFTAPGTYQIFYFAKDDLSENVSPLMASTVYKAKSGNAAPGKFNIFSPKDGASVLTTVLLEWQDATDPNGDKLSYTVLISKDDTTFTNPIRKEGLEYSACVVSAEDGLEDLTTYYWKVQAIDQYGAIRETGIRMFHTNNTNPIAGWLKGHVYDGATGLPLTSAALLVGATALNTAAGGYYLGILSPGNYSLTVSASGYFSKTISDVKIPEGTIVSQNVALTPRGSEDVKAFVTRFYQLCLGRDPDQAGLDGWVTALMDGTLTGSDVAYGFVFSPEFLERNTANDVYLRVLYKAFFNRDPDPAGWAGWMSELDKGAEREQVLKGFIYAQEFNELCRAYRIMPNPVAAFVTRFYQLCLKRDPDIAGLDGWVASLLTGANVGADVAEGFIFSPEFTKTIMSDEAYMRILYKAFFNRDPDAAGLAGWLQALDAGASRTEVLNGFIYSKEFGELCLRFGIIPFR